MCRVLMDVIYLCIYQEMALPNFVICVLTASMLWTTCSALECYVCSNQTDNHEKCLNTIKTCEQGEDVCLSEIRWGSQPYFSQGALKQYYVSKKCSTKQLCTKIRNRYMRYCTHIWYEDWTCSECCQGDRCNYYIISGSSKMLASAIAVVAMPLILVVRKMI